MALQLQESLNTLVLRFNALPAVRKMTLAAVVAASIAAIVGLYLWGSATEYKVLFSNLSERDAGTVTATLQTMNVPYQTEANGTLLVPASQVYDLRFKLAAQGIPKGGAVGFELMDSPKLGMTQFQEQLAFQRGLEGELARTIQSLAPVESARVHLAIPKPSVFIRDKQSRSASVLVNLHPGRALDPGQVQSIVHLVSSSVPELSPNSVTVVDQAGNLLTAKSDAQSLRGLNSSQLEYTKAMEAYFVQRIEAIVAPIVGAGNVKAEVRADLDFSEDEATSESYRPNPTPDAQSIRSQQTVEDINNAGTQAQGVPGALTNQPPGPATAPVTAPPGANAGPNAVAAAGQGGNSSRKENTVNFELDKTIRHVKASQGRIKRLSVAVVVNHRTARDNEGKAGKPTPLSAQEMTQINSLVREAMGFSQPRGHRQCGQRSLHRGQGRSRRAALEGSGQRRAGQGSAQEPDHLRPGLLSGVRRVAADAARSGETARGGRRGRVGRRGGRRGCVRRGWRGLWSGRQADRVGGYLCRDPRQGAGVRQGRAQGHL